MSVDPRPARSPEQPPETLLERLSVELPKPKDWQALQRNCVVLFRAELNDRNTQEYGRLGQGQNGIDILGRRDGRGDHFVGIQCRRVQKPLRGTDISTDCENALRLEPRLKEIIFATTAPDDAKATDAAMAVEQDLRARGHDIVVTVYGWTGLQSLIAEHDAAYAAFAPWHDGRTARSAEIERALQEALSRVPGLPIAVARSIVEAFGETGEDESPGQIERILRRKAEEYQLLKSEILKLSAFDQKVAGLREQALALIDLGRFDEAELCFSQARDIDREARLKADDVVKQRRASEAETLAATARLAALRGRYQEAVRTCLEAVEVAGGAAVSAGASALLLAAAYLREEVDRHGEAESAKANISIMESRILPLADAGSVAVQIAAGYELAELYALDGYRSADGGTLLQAVRLLRNLGRRLPSDIDPALRRSIHTRLGDTHVDAGLNRKSVAQARLGVRIMEASLAADPPSSPSASGAKAYIRLGTAYANLGLLCSGTDTFERSAQAYRAALTFAEPEDTQTLAYIHWGLGIALADWGAREGRIDLLKEAEFECDLALGIYSLERDPINWATVMTNRGNAKLERGTLENSDGALRSAVKDYEHALTIRTPERFGLGFLKTSGNMGIAKGRLADRVGDLPLAEEAYRDLSAALSSGVGSPLDHWTSYYEQQRALITATIERLRALAS